MRCLILLTAISTLALAEPLPGAEIARPAKLDMDSVFEGAIGAAGFAVVSGKLAFVRRGHLLAATVGRSTLTPLVDVNFGGASAVMRFAF